MAEVILVGTAIACVIGCIYFSKKEKKEAINDKEAIVTKIEEDKEGNKIYFAEYEENGEKKELILVRTVKLYVGLKIKIRALPNNEGYAQLKEIILKDGKRYKVDDYNAEPLESDLVGKRVKENKLETENSNLGKTIENAINNWKCPKCGELNSRGFCKECGTPKKVPNDKICMNCGAKLKENQKFCSECGTKVR